MASPEKLLLRLSVSKLIIQTFIYYHLDHLIVYICQSVLYIPRSV